MLVLKNLRHYCSKITYESCPRSNKSVNTNYYMKINNASIFNKIVEGNKFIRIIMYRNSRRCISVKINEYEFLVTFRVNKCYTKWEDLDNYDDANDELDNEYEVNFYKHSPTYTIRTIIHTV